MSLSDRAPSVQRPHSLWLLLLLVAAEFAALTLVLRSAWPPDSPASLWTWIFLADPASHSLISPFSVLVAALVLLSGVLPALLRPSHQTLVAGCLATVLAGILVTPFSAQDLPRNFFDNPLAWSANPFLILRLVNGVCIGPLAFHLAARFPLRHPISGRQLAAVYALSLGLLFVLLLVRVKEACILAALVLMLWTVALVIAAGWLLLRSSRVVNQGDPRPAQQARLLFISVALAGLPALLRPIGLAFRIELIPFDLMLAALTLIPIGIAYAVLRHDLFGIDRLMRRALAYAALSLLLLVIYFALTLGLTALLVRIWPGLRGMATLLSLFAAALAFEPSRRRLQGWIDRFLYPDQTRFQRAVHQAGETLAGVANRDEIVQLLTETLPASLGSEWASLSQAPTSAKINLPERNSVWDAALVAGGRSLGHYWLGPRHLGPGYDPDEQAQLQVLIGQAALAFAYADTIADLRTLNRELEERVANRTAQLLDQQRALAAYDERQRLARELHDSVTQSLFSINLSARALRNLVRRDPTGAIDGLSELEQAAQQALAEMRGLLAQLRSNEQPLLQSPDSLPPGLGQDSGPPSPEMVDLAAMLREQCLRLECGSLAEDGRQTLHIDLDAPETLYLPASIAHELIQAAREAFHNALKHSGVKSAECRLDYTDGMLRMMIQDHGVGFTPPDMLGGSDGATQLDLGRGQTGYGLRGIQERLAALHGYLEIRSGPGAGAMLQISLPYCAQPSPSDSLSTQFDGAIE